jgi:hypothetical protein
MEEWETVDLLKASVIASSEFTKSKSNLVTCVGLEC